MPASFAHYRFGKQLLPSLPGPERQCIQRFRRMFDVGLQGPDIFFYYNPYVKTAVGALGSKFHAITGQELFPAACAAADTEAGRAYLYGLLAHYCLDSVCHPYVQRLADIGEAAHVPLESEFERFLLVLDKHPAPHTYDISKKLRLTRGECMTVARFYPPASGTQVGISLRSMAFSTNFLASPNWKWREAVLKRVKPSLLDYRIPHEEDPELALYVRELKELYDRAAEKYPSLLAQLTAHMQTGEPLGEDFALAFG
ncbi:MAG: hypothetical protein IJN67_06215 [Oscillospiraceae bacterium]|nr:hypothetical protein [Oscillospiraceae bacterium]